MKTNLIYPIFILIIVCITISCHEKIESNELFVDKSPVNYYIDKNKFEEAANLRTTDFSNIFSIDHVKRADNTLFVQLSHAKGCEGSFDIIWNGAVMESYPMQISLFIKFNATGCRTDEPGESISKIIAINLVQFIGDENLIKNTVFQISNASSIQDVKCEGNCDETVSNK
jgi:hypothetical protein